MPFPVPEDVVESPNLSGNVHTLSLPGTINTGDLLVAVHSSYQNGIDWANQGSGWTELYDSEVGSVGQGQTWVKKADGGEGSSVDVENVSNTSGFAGSGQVYRVSGWSGTLTPGTNGLDHATATGSSDTPDPPSLAAPWGSAENLWLAIVHAADDDASIDSAPTNYTNLFNTLSGGGSNASASTGSARHENAVQTEDPGTFTLSQSEGWIGTTIVIEPPAGAGFGVTHNIGNPGL